MEFLLEWGWPPWIAALLLISLFVVIQKIREHRSRRLHPPNNVRQGKVILRVAETWVNTIVAFFVVIVLFAVVGFLVARVLGPRAMIMLVRGTLVTTLVLFVLSEMILALLTRARRVHRDPHKEKSFPRFSAAVDRLYKRNSWLMPRPRLYIGNFMDLPNACAFGMGLFGQYGVMISPQLYELLDDDELEGVVAHEIAHIRHLDVGLLTVVAILTGLCKSFANKLGPVKTPGTVAMTLALQVVNRLIFPIGVSTIQCEREYSADALGALYSGTGKPLKRALQKLQNAVEPFLKEQEENSSVSQQILKPLTPTHPNMAQRFDSLDNIEL